MRIPVSRLSVLYRMNKPGMEDCFLSASHLMSYQHFSMSSLPIAAPIVAAPKILIRLVKHDLSWDILWSFSAQSSLPGFPLHA